MVTLSHPRRTLGIAAPLVALALLGSPDAGAGRPAAERAARGTAEGAAEGSGLIGTAAPAWHGLEWLQGGPLSLSQLRGKAVLLRFWTAGCSLCTQTAPALNELWAKYRDRGLVVIGVHHPKSADARNGAVVLGAARTLGFQFPVAKDDEWATLKAYGVGTRFQRFTSVSVLIDARGIIRWVHPGGEYHPGGGPEHRSCNEGYEGLKAAIERAIAAGLTRTNPGADAN